MVQIKLSGLQLKRPRWFNVLKTLVCYHLIHPGSEWLLHRHWYDNSAMGDLLGEDFALVQSSKLYRSPDQLLFKLGAAKKDMGRAYGLVHFHLPKHDRQGELMRSIKRGYPGVYRNL